MSFIEILQYILVTTVGILLSYQMLLSILAFKAEKIRNFTASRKRKFAIVIPAYNEEKVISRSLYSLSGLVYPKNMYDLVVVADNCTDNSAMIAYKLGATVLERSNEVERGKGYALQWAFNQILEWDEQYDAIVVFDSDSLVSGNYLEVMNYYLDHGSKVIQGSDLVLPQPDSWTVEATRIGFLLYNFVRPLGRKVLGFGTGLCGNGMCFSTEVFRKIPRQAWSMTEDGECGLILQLNGVKIDFAPEANVWAEMPEAAQSAELQRKRWEMGRYSIIWKYAPKLLAAAIKEKSLKYLDTLVDLVTPPLINTLFFTLLMCIANLAFWMAGWESLLFFWMWAIATGVGVAHLLVGLVAAGADRQLIKSVIYIPIYALWKIKIYVNSFFSKQGSSNKNRVRTERESNNMISESESE